MNKKFMLLPLLFLTGNAHAFTTELEGIYGTQTIIQKEGDTQLRNGSVGRNYNVPTDIYVNNGDVLTVEVSGAGSATICIDKLTEPGVCSTEIDLEEGINEVTASVTGEVYVGNHLAVGEEVTVDVTGGQYMPIFELGVNTDTEFLTMIDQSNTYENIHLVSDNVVITAPIKKYRDYNITNPTELMSMWEDILEAGQYQYGINSGLDNPNSIHESIHSKLHWMDVGNNGSGTLYSDDYHLGTGTDSAFEDIAITDNLSGYLEPDSGWDVWAEYGHTLQPSKVLNFDGMNQVTANLTALYVQTELFGLTSNLEEKWAPIITPYLLSSDQGKDFFSDEGVEPLGFFWQLHLTFGDRFYKRLISDYRQENLDTSGSLESLTSNEKVQTLLLKASAITGYDLRDLYKKWGLPIDQETEDKFDVNWRLKDAGEIWLNTDLSQPNTHFNFGEDIAVTYNEETSQLFVNYDFYRTDKNNYRVQIELNGEYIASYKNGTSSYLKHKEDTFYARQILWRSNNISLEIGDIVTVNFEESNGFEHTFTYEHTGTDVSFDGETILITAPDEMLEGVESVVILADDTYIGNYYPETGSCIYCYADQLDDSVVIEKGTNNLGELDLNNSTMIEVIYKYHDDREPFVYYSYLTDWY